MNETRRYADPKLVGAGIGTLLFSGLVLKDALGGGEDPVSMTIFGVIFALFGGSLIYAAMLPEKASSDKASSENSGYSFREAEDA